MIEEILERSINRALALDAVSPEKMQRLAGKIIALEIEDLDQVIHLVPDKDGVQARQPSEQSPDVAISGRFADYLRGAAATLRHDVPREDDAQPDDKVQLQEATRGSIRGSPTVSAGACHTASGRSGLG